MIKNLIPKVTRMKIKSYIKSENKFKDLVRKERKIIIALAADYGNLGDVAITFAQKKFLEDNFNDYKIIELYTPDIVSNIRCLKRKITSNDIITIVGGGNMGDAYQYYEDARKFLINEFKNNLIVIFPQTIDFSKTKKGKKYFKDSIKIYNKHKNLVMFAREKNTYDILLKYFYKCDVLELPDIVLSLDESDDKIERKNNIILCLREDKEKMIEDSIQKEIQLVLKKGFPEYEILYRDTHIGKISLNNREKELYKIWNDFKKSRVVVTDRLHGMLFCAITKTPCIAFNNSNGKVKNVYERWLKNLDYIKVMESYNSEDFINLIKQVINVKNKKSFESDYFTDACKYIKSKIR